MSLEPDKWKAFSTEADGNCAFHAIFGEYDSGRQRFVCQDVTAKRKQVAQLITEKYKKGDKDVINAVNLGLLNIGADGRNDEAAKCPAIMQLKKYLEVQFKAQDDATDILIKIIKENQTLAKTIDDIANSIEHVAEFTDIRGKFWHIYNTHEQMLKEFISKAGNAELSLAYDTFVRILKKIPLDDGGVNKSIQEYFEQHDDAMDAVLSELDEHLISKPAEWLPEQFIPAIAVAAKIDIIYYKRSKNPTELNNGDVCTGKPGGKASREVRVYFNDSNHFERIESASWTPGSLPKPAPPPPPPEPAAPAPPPPPEPPPVTKKIICFHRATKQAGDSYLDPAVTVYAPDWVIKLLPTVNQWLEGYEIIDQSTVPPTRKSIVGSTLTLQELQMIARNEAVNTDGGIYGKFPGLSQEQIYTIKDLVRHCVVVGKDTAKSYGGYPLGTPITPINPTKPCIICDLAALQFQQSYNSGRLVLIPVDSSLTSLPSGALDKEIFKEAVSREQKTAAEVATLNPEQQKQFPNGTFNGKSVRLDLEAYKQIVAQDFMLASLAIAKQGEPAEKIWFNFLNYGTGFFADNLSYELQQELKINIYEGILLGLQKLLSDPDLKSQLQSINTFNFPFFVSPDSLSSTLSSEQQNYVRRIKTEIVELCKQHGKTALFENCDSLMPHEGFTVATTNCGDPHAMLGNEMDYGSVDAAIGENLQNNGNHFSALLNSEMNDKFLEIPKPAPKPEVVPPPLPLVDPLAVEPFPVIHPPPAPPPPPLPEAPPLAGNTIRLYRATNGELAIKFSNHKKPDVSKFLQYGLLKGTTYGENSDTLYVGFSSSSPAKPGELVFEFNSEQEKKEFIDLFLKDNPNIISSNDNARLLILKSGFFSSNSNKGPYQDLEFNYDLKDLVLKKIFQKLLKQEKDPTDSENILTVEELKFLTTANNISLTKFHPITNTSLLQAAVRARNYEVTEYLLSSLPKGDLDAQIHAQKDANNNTALHSAAYNGDEKLVSILMDYGAKLTIKNYNNETPLYRANNRTDPVTTEQKENLLTLMVSKLIDRLLEQDPNDKAIQISEGQIVFLLNNNSPLLHKLRITGGVSSNDGPNKTKVTLKIEDLKTLLVAEEYILSEDAQYITPNRLSKSAYLTTAAPAEKFEAIDEPFTEWLSKKYGIIRCGERGEKNSNQTTSMLYGFKSNEDRQKFLQQFSTYLKSIKPPSDGYSLPPSSYHYRTDIDGNPAVLLADINQVLLTPYQPFNKLLYQQYQKDVKTARLSKAPTVEALNQQIQNLKHQLIDLQIAKQEIENHDDPNKGVGRGGRLDPTGSRLDRFTGLSSEAEEGDQLYRAVAGYKLSLQAFIAVHEDLLSREQIVALQFARDTLMGSGKKAVATGLKADSNFIDFLKTYRWNKLHEFWAKHNKEELKKIDQDLDVAIEQDAQQLLNGCDNTRLVITANTPEKYITDKKVITGNGKYLESFRTIPKFFPENGNGDETTDEIILQTGGMSNHSTMVRIWKELYPPQPKDGEEQYYRFYRTEYNTGAGCHAANSGDNTCLGTYTTEISGDYFDKDGNILKSLSTTTEKTDYYQEMRKNIFELIKAERRIMMYKPPKAGPHGELAASDPEEQKRWHEQKEKIRLYGKIENDHNKYFREQYSFKGVLQFSGNCTIKSQKQLLEDVVARKLFNSGKSGLKIEQVRTQAQSLVQLHYGWAQGHDKQRTLQDIAEKQTSLTAEIQELEKQILAAGGNLPPPPAKPGLAPAKPGPAPAKPGPAPAKPGPAPAKPGPAPAKPGPAPAKPILPPLPITPIIVNQELLSHWQELANISVKSDPSLRPLAPDDTIALNKDFWKEHFDIKPDHTNPIFQDLHKKKFVCSSQSVKSEEILKIHNSDGKEEAILQKDTMSCPRKQGKDGSYQELSDNQQNIFIAFLQGLPISRSTELGVQKMLTVEINAFSESELHKFITKLENLKKEGKPVFVKLELSSSNQTTPTINKMIADYNASLTAGYNELLKNYPHGTPKGSEFKIFHK